MEGGPAPEASRPAQRGPEAASTRCVREHAPPGITGRWASELPLLGSLVPHPRSRPVGPGRATAASIARHVPASGACRPQHLRRADQRYARTARYRAGPHRTPPDAAPYAGLGPRLEGRRSRGQGARAAALDRPARGVPGGLHARALARGPHAEPGDARRPVEARDARDHARGRRRVERPHGPRRGDGAPRRAASPSPGPRGTSCSTAMPPPRSATTRPSCSPTDAALLLYHDSFSQTYDVERALELRALLLRLMPHVDPSTQARARAAHRRGRAGARAGAGSLPRPLARRGRGRRRRVAPRERLRRCARPPLDAPASPRCRRGCAGSCTRRRASRPSFPAGRGSRSRQASVIRWSCARARSSMPRASSSCAGAATSRGSSPGFRRWAPRGVRARGAAHVRRRGRRGDAHGTARARARPAAHDPVDRALAQRDGDVDRAREAPSAPAARLRAAAHDHHACDDRDDRPRRVPASPRGHRSDPLGTFFVEVHPDLYVPAGYEVTPAVSPEVLARSLGAPPGQVLFLGADARASPSRRRVRAARGRAARRSAVGPPSGRRFSVRSTRRRWI